MCSSIRICDLDQMKERDTQWIYNWTFTLKNGIWYSNQKELFYDFC